MVTLSCSELHPKVPMQKHRGGLMRLALTCWQAAAGFVMADAEAQRFHLSLAQQLVLTNEYGSDASPFFSAGPRTLSSTLRTHAIGSGSSI